MSSRYSGRQMRYYDPSATPMPRNPLKALRQNRPRESRSRGFQPSKADVVRVGRATMKRQRRAERNLEQLRKQNGGSDA